MAGEQSYISVDGVGKLTGSRLERRAFAVSDYGEVSTCSDTTTEWNREAHQVQI